MTDQKSKIVVADTHEIVRDAVSGRIEQSCDVDVVAKTEDGYATLKACRQHQPDILLMDLSLVRPSGTEILSKVQKTFPNMRVIVVSDSTATISAIHALSHGAIAFMSKQAKAVDYVNAVNAAIGGYTYLPVDVLAQFVKSRRNLMRSGNVFGLSPREIEVLESCVNGLSSKQVAKNLDISVRTVETHRHSIYKKTDCRSIDDLSLLMPTI